MRRFCFFFLPALLLSLASGTLGDEGKKTKKRKIGRSGNVHVAFVHGQNHFVVIDRTGDAVMMSYPEMEVVRRYQGETDKKINAMDSSRNGRWLAVHFKKGGLWVWDVEATKPQLVLPEASRGFKFHPREEVLVVHQPKIGVTQWNLLDATQVGPTISAVQYSSRDSLWISRTGDYLLTHGVCNVNRERYEFCVFDLADGTPVAWTRREGNDVQQRMFSDVYEKEPEFIAILAATDLLQRNCRWLEDHRFFCSSMNSIALIDDDKSSPIESPPARSPAEMFREYPGRYLWEIRAGKGMRGFSSSDVSRDQKWVIVGTPFMEILLFNAEELEAKSPFWAMGYSWRQPTLVKSIVVP